MPRSIPAFAEPSVLRWARETIGLTEVAAARKISVPDDRVAAWEAGEAQPTIAQLKKAAEVYKRSLAVFFLPDPPNDFDTLRDFRRHQGAQPDEWSPALHEDYRRAHQQRDQALELADLEGYQPPTTWRLDPLPVDDDTLAAAARRAHPRRPGKPARLGDHDPRDASDDSREPAERHHQESDQLGGDHRRADRHHRLLRPERSLLRGCGARRVGVRPVIRRKGAAMEAGGRDDPLGATARRPGRRLPWRQR